MSDRITASGGVDRSKFQVEVADGVTLGRNDMIEHIDHGPMYVDGVAVGQHSKTVTLVSDMGPEALELSGDQMREMWGEQIAADPFDLRDPGTASYTKEFTGADGDTEVTLEVEGPGEKADYIMTYLDDHVGRVLQAFEDEHPPSESDAKFEIDWESVFSDDDA